MHIPDLESLKCEYESLEEVKAQGVIIRAKANCVEEGEKNTKYFMQLEKRNHEVKHIRSLVTEKGVVTNPMEILGNMGLGMYCRSGKRILLKTLL